MAYSQCSTLLSVEAPDTKSDRIDSMPWPGEEMVFRVSNQSDRRKFLESGEHSVRDLEVMLALAGHNIADFKRILDFGCGCSRMLLWMEDVAESSELFGVDIDERMIAWGQKNVPWATLSVNKPLPKLDFPDGYFDLVYSASVFTHIDEDYQDQWLAELKRVTKPGSILLLTVHGEYVTGLLDEAEVQAGHRDMSNMRSQLNDKGICFLDNDIFVGGPFPNFYHSTLHAPWYIFEHWGRLFDVRAYVSRASANFQDYVMLERPPDDVELKPIQMTRNAVSPAHAAPAPQDASPRLILGHSKADWRRYLERGLRRVARKVLGPPTEAPQPATTAPVETGNKIAGGYPVSLLVERMGERVNRLESDVWAELRLQQERMDRLEKAAETDHPAG